MEIEKTLIPKESEEKFIKILKTLISDYYKFVIEREKEICSFGILTDSDISGFIIHFNTQSGMKRIIDSGIDWNKSNPNDKLKIDSGKWWMPEWESESIDHESFFQDDKREKELHSILENLIKKTYQFEKEGNYINEAFVKYKEEIFDLICQSLKELKEENLFKEVSKDFFLLVQESDNGIYGGREISLKKIMTKNQFEEYQKEE